MLESSQTERIARVIQEYDAQGWHRSGTEADHVSARWLAKQVSECGLEPELERFDLSRVDPELARVESGGQRVEGVPLFDGGFTGPDGVRGRTGLLGSDAEIGVVEVGSDPRAGLMEARRAGIHQAIVVVTPTAPGMAVMNAVDFLTPFGPPVLQVGSEARERLMEHARLGSEGYVVVAVTRTPAESFNVTSRIPGRDDSLDPVVVMTPRSGWWHCAGERGGGIAAWLEVMRSMAETEPERDALFVATSGHEIGLPGIEKFLGARPGIVRDARAWVHFGANIGASPDATLRHSASDEELGGIARKALNEAGVGSAEPSKAMVGAESRLVSSRRARCAAMVGGHYRLFHREADRWPSTIDVDTIARCANAFAAVASNLASGAV